MHMIVDVDAVVALWDQLKRPWMPGHPHIRRSAADSILREGWACRADVQDLLWEKDDRADAAFRHNALEGLFAANQLFWKSRFRRPNAREKQVMGGYQLAAADVAAFLIAVERLGFNVEPARLIDPLLPKVRAQKWVDNSELALLWYQRERHKLPPAGMRVEGATPSRFEILQLQSGYQVTAFFDDLVPVGLRVIPPGYNDGIKASDWAEIAIRRPVLI